MEYLDILTDVLEAIADQNVENLIECAEDLWNLANKKFPISDDESEVAQQLKDELEAIAE